ncbi:MAG: DegQ family serine endoprotease [Gammaproteobacteria bacterium]|nr:DegQ family serine endoprotease [Gammaproteobacteria bacterium]
MRRVFVGTALAVAIASAIQLGAAGPGFARPAETTSSAAVADIGPTGSFAPLVERVQPAVVNISTVTAAQPAAMLPQLPPGNPMNEYFKRFFGVPGDGAMAPEMRGAGSGFIIDPAGYIVTNNHVVDGAREITVTLETGKQLPAKVVGTDEKTDLALIKVDSDVPLAHVDLGDSDATHVGDWVLAVGNPFGLGGTVTAGIVSARGRDIHSGPYDDYLQVDAPINRGNSGGPLFDRSGKVIGINAAIYSPSGGNVGIGFAIPANLARPVLDALKTSGHVERGWIGVNIQSIDEMLAESLGLKKPEGALVASVLADGPAQRAGVKVGDVIVRFNGRPIDQMRDLPREVASMTPGQDAQMVVIRDGKEKQLSLTVDRMSSQELASADNEDRGEAVEGARLGVMLADLDEQTRARLQLDDQTQGALIANVVPGSPAARTGLRSGDLIRRVGQESVDSASEAVKAIRSARDHSAKSVVLLVQRQGDVRFVAVPFEKA